MDVDMAMSLAAQTLWLIARVSAPILGMALLVGLFVSIFQVATQIQEMTLTFVPKMLAVFFVLLFLGHWMLLAITEFASALIRNIPTFFH
jgi:flagellar biosynthetic protein FliQ